MLCCTIYREKIADYLQFFDSCWRHEVSNFCLRQFGEVETFCEPHEADVDINNINSLDNSGSNETMQKVLALIVWLWRNFQKKFEGPKFQKLELLRFSSDLGEI